MRNWRRRSARCIAAKSSRRRSASRSPSRTGGLISQRELEVLGLIRQGFSNDEIARLLGISERTVRAHVTALRANLNAADRAQAVARGFELGLLKIGAIAGA